MYSMPSRTMASSRRILLCAWLIVIATLLVPPMIARPAPGDGLVRLVKDFNPTVDPLPGSSPREFTTIGDITYFVATDSSNGRELWRTDGTPAGTTLLKDISAGWGGAFDDPQLIRSFELTDVNGTLFFALSNGLWKSDGTAAGTLFVKEIRAYSSVALSDLTNVGGKLFFVGNDGNGNDTLWTSDGTTDGTVPLILLNPASIDPQLVGVDGTLFFSNGNQLWKSDGTVAGTVLVKDAAPRSLRSMNGLLFFFISSGPNTGLWKSDGTEAGTVKIAPIGYLESLTVVDGVLFFSTGDWLWKSDGSTAGTVQVSTKGSGPYYLTDVNGTVFFIKRDRELWKSDGTDAGTERVADLRPYWTGDTLQQLTNVNGTLFFVANQRGGPNGFVYDLWKSDGTAAGTTVVKGGWEMAPFLASAGNILLMAAHSSANGVELWKSDGSEAGTVLLKDINIVRGSTGYYGATAIGDTYFFIMPATGGRQLWKTDGTEAGTVLVADIFPGPLGPYPAEMHNVNGTIFMFGSASSNHDIWQSDGTAAGTMPLKPGAFVATPSKPANINGVLYFQADDGIHGDELWKSDGTDAGTVLVADINPGSADSFPSAMMSFNGRVYFTAVDGSHGRELWMTDGTPAGTALVKDINPGTPGSSPVQFNVLNGALFFPATGGDGDRALWKSDGTAGGTAVLKDLNPNGTDLYTGMFATANDLLFFTVMRGAGWDLWKSDGTAAGTQMLKDGQPDNLVGLNDTLFFLFDDGVHGRELWKTDGTTAGTSMVADIMPGRSGSAISLIVRLASENSILFGASDGVAGAELWLSDGTAAGTVLVQDIAPGPGSSYPTGIGLVGSRLYVTADDGEHGRELLSGPLAGVDFYGLMALGGSVTTRSGQAVSGTLNAQNRHGYPLTFSIVANGQKGVATITDAATGAFSYIPTPGAVGEDSFTFQVNDGRRTSNVATISVAIGDFYSYLPALLR